MRRIIVNIEGDDLTDSGALLYVYEVIRQGRISKDDTQYCYATRFGGSFVTVYAGRTKNGTDTFRVVRDKHESK